ncbi:MAG: peptidylprolyl isomerase [Planctomycetota bacterium]
MRTATRHPADLPSGGRRRAYPGGPQELAVRRGAARFDRALSLVARATAALVCVLAPCFAEVAPPPPEGAPREENAEGVVATVNGEPITRAELVREALIRHGESVLEDMIRTRAVEEQVDAELEHEKRALRADPREKRTLEAMVAEEYRMSMDGYRGIVKRWLLVRKLLLKRENPTDDQVMLWFYENRERYDTPAEYTVRHIFISWKSPHTGKERGKPEVERRIARVREGLIKDDDFGRLARRYSDDRATRDRGGELGTVNERAARVHLEPGFVEAMVLLKPGQSGGPVETRKGFHFLQVTACKEGRQANFKDFRTAARMDYLEERAEIPRNLLVRQLMEQTKVTRSFVPPERTTDTGTADER